MASHPRDVERKSRPGGRASVVVRSVYRATEELARENRSANLTIQLIASRSGVGPSSIYRRWGDLCGLLREIHNKNSRCIELHDFGSLREDARDWARQLISFYQDPVNNLALRRLISDQTHRESIFADAHSAKATLLTAKYREEVLDPQILIDLIVAPIIYRAIYTPTSLYESLAGDLAFRLTGATELDE